MEREITVPFFDLKRVYRADKALIDAALHEVLGLASTFLEMRQSI